MLQNRLMALWQQICRKWECVKTAWSEDSGMYAHRRLARMTRMLKKRLEETYEFRHNVLDGTTECRCIGQKDAGFQAVDRRMLNRIMEEMRLKGVAPVKSDVQMMVLSEEVPAYHPFRAYLSALPEWDGQDRVTELLARVSGDAFWLSTARKWMRAMVSQWGGLPRTHANVLTPVLISRRQGMGKSTFARMLLPECLRMYYLDSLSLNAAFRPEEKLARMGLVNLDEFDRLGERQQALLKNLLQLMDIPLYRGKELGWVHAPRLASCIATTNSLQFLTDGTGSRRFLCVEVERPIPQTPINYEQLYAQLWKEACAGLPDYLTPREEGELQHRNLIYYRSSPLEELLRTYYRLPSPEEEGIWLTAMEIFRQLHAENPASLRGSTPRQVSLCLGNLGFRMVHRNIGNCWLVQRRAKEGSL